MSPASFAITGCAVGVGRVGPVVVHPRVERPERRGEPFSGVARPVVARETARWYRIGTTVRSCLSCGLEFYRDALEGSQSAVQFVRGWSRRTAARLASELTSPMEAPSVRDSLKLSLCRWPAEPLLRKDLSFRESEKNRHRRNPDRAACSQTGWPPAAEQTHVVPQDVWWEWSGARPGVPMSSAGKLAVVKDERQSGEWQRA